MNNVQALLNQLNAQMNTLLDSTEEQPSSDARMALLRHRLSVAAILGNTTEVLALLPHITDLLSTDSTSNSPLYYAFINGHNDIAEPLLTKALKAQESCYVEFCQALSNPAYLQFLLAHKADRPDKTNTTPLEQALHLGNWSLARRLAPLTVQRYYQGCQSLHRAVFLQQPYYCDFLLAHGADINVLTQKTDKTSLAFMAALGSLTMVTYLCSKPGIRLNPIDALGFTPCLYALTQGHTAVTVYLLLQTAMQLPDNFQQQGQFYTPLSYLTTHYANTSLHYQALSYLLSERPQQPAQLFNHWLTLAKQGQTFNSTDKSMLLATLEQIYQHLSHWVANHGKQQPEAYQQLLQQLDTAIQQETDQTGRQLTLVCYQHCLQEAFRTNTYQHLPVQPDTFVTPSLNNPLPFSPS